MTMKSRVAAFALAFLVGNLFADDEIPIPSFQNPISQNDNYQLTTYRGSLVTLANGTAAFYSPALAYVGNWNPGPHFILYSPSTGVGEKFLPSAGLFQFGIDRKAAQAILQDPQNGFHDPKNEVTGIRVEGGSLGGESVAEWVLNFTSQGDEGQLYQVLAFIDTDRTQLKPLYRKIRGRLIVKYGTPLYDRSPGIANWNEYDANSIGMGGYNSYELAQMLNWCVLHPDMTPATVFGPRDGKGDVLIEVCGPTNITLQYTSADFEAKKQQVTSPGF